MLVEAGRCRWCGRPATFAAQLVIGGGISYVTEQACTAVDRVGQVCERRTISDAAPSRRTRGRR